VKQHLMLAILLIFGVVLVAMNDVSALEQQSSGDAQNQVQTANTTEIQTNVTNSSETQIQTTNTPENQVQANNFNAYNINGARGIWLWASNVDEISGTELQNSGATDVFVLTKGGSGALYYSALSSAINKLSGTGIRVHAWIVCFYDTSTSYPDGWVNAADTGYQQHLFNIISYITRNYGVNGIHLDYVRFSGRADKNRAAWQQTPHGKETITSFVAGVSNLVRSIRSDVAVSAAVIAEKEQNADLYGQDYELMADHLDFFVPMIYGSDTGWIGSTTRYIVDHAKGKPVLAGLSSYDSNYNPVPQWELQQRINAAMSNGAVGYVLFRYGLLNKVVYSYMGWVPYVKKKYRTRYRVRYLAKYRYRGKWRTKWRTKWVRGWRYIWGNRWGTKYSYRYIIS